MYTVYILWVVNPYLYYQAWLCRRFCWLSHVQIGHQGFNPYWSDDFFVDCFLIWKIKGSKTDGKSGKVKERNHLLSLSRRQRGAPFYRYTGTPGVNAIQVLWLLGRVIAMPFSDQRTPVISYISIRAVLDPNCHFSTREKNMAVNQLLVVETELVGVRKAIIVAPITKYVR
jgi:hypothetical protein